MIEPTLALQTAIRSALMASPEVLALVPAAHIRAGSTRPDNLPSVKLANGQTIFLGNASGSQYAARVFLDLHIWAIEDGAFAAQSIGFAVLNALKDAPESADMAIDEWQKPAVRWMRDPDPNLVSTHGLITVECVMRWQV